MYSVNRQVAVLQAALLYAQANDFCPAEIMSIQYELVEAIAGRSKPRKRKRKKCSDG